MGKRKEEIISEAKAVIWEYRNLYYGKNSEMGKDSRNENEKKGKSLRSLNRKMGREVNVNFSCQDKL